MQLSLSGFLCEDNYATQSVAFPEFCAIARAAGYDGVELRETQVSPATPKVERGSLLAIVRDAGLTVTCLTARGLPAGCRERDEFFGRYLDLCCDLECRLLKISGDTGWLRTAAALAQERNVILGTNNHIGSRLETVEGTRRYFEEIAHPNIALLYDALHLSLGGEDYLGAISRFSGITRNILIHSVRPASSGEPLALEHNGRRWCVALPDEPGVLQDWPAVFAGFKRMRYDGLITVIENGWPVERRVDVANNCARILREMWQRG